MVRFIGDSPATGRDKANPFIPTVYNNWCMSLVAFTFFRSASKLKTSSIVMTGGQGENMSAAFSVQSNQVLVTIQGALGYDIWPVLRNGREAACRAGLPVRIDIAGCSSGDMAGVGSLLLAQDRLQEVEFDGCSGIFPASFKAFGICKRCSAQAPFPAACIKRSALRSR